MTLIGAINKLTIKRVKPYGAHLDGGESGDILLPKQYVEKGCKKSDEVEVFVYTDKQGRLRATTQTPCVMPGQFGFLRVVENTSSGAYLDWGLNSDLFVPVNEQITKMFEGQSYIVFLFIDKKNNRVDASLKLDKFLGRLPPQYKKGEEVDLLICGKTDLGYSAIINNSHLGMIYKNEVFQELNTGQQLKGFIKTVREDLKVDLAIQKPGYGRIDATSRDILDKIKSTLR